MDKYVEITNRKFVNIPVGGIFKCKGIAYRKTTKRDAELIDKESAYNIFSKFSFDDELVVAKCDKN